MQDCRNRYGDSFSLRFLGFERPMVLISDPAAIKALYTERANGLPPGRNIVLEPILGSRSVLLLEGAEHLARRKLMLPAFHGERLRSYEPTVEEIVDHRDRLLATSPRVPDPLPDAGGHPGGDPARRLRRRRGPAAGAPARDAGDGADRNRLADRAAGRPRGAALRRPWPWARFEGQLKAVDELLYAEIAEHRSRPDLAEREDILSMLMRAEFEDGSQMDDGELRDQLMTLLLAGHETTATALAWTFDLLLRHQAVLQRLRDSLEAGAEDYLRATISESLRLRPVVPLAGRRLAEELSVEGLTLPPGTDVTPAIWLTHTRADLYPEPFAFKPERFLEEAPDTYAWIPFGGGIRRCLGASFAEFEMRIVLREVLTRCDLRKADPAPEKTGRRNITLSPKDGTPVVVTARQPAGERRVAVRLARRRRAAAGRVFLRPAGDRARAGDHLAVVEDEDRHLVGAAQPLHLGPLPVAAAPGPGHQPVAADGPQLVLVPGRVERLAGLRARMGERRPGFLLPAGVEDHRPRADPPFRCAFRAADV